MEYAQFFILFHTSNHAFRAEKVLRSAKVPCRLVPVPRHLSSDCGVCLRLDQAQGKAACDMLKAAKVDVATTHPA